MPNPVNYPAPEDSPTEVVAKLNEWFEDGERESHEARVEAEEGFDFYAGDQWDEADKAALEQAGRPALTINRIFPTVNSLSGTERQNRRAIKAYPRRGGTATVANLKTALMQHAIDESNGAFLLSEMFKEAVIGTQGWIQVNIEPDDDGSGRIVIEQPPTLEVMADPFAQEMDVNASARYIIRVKQVDRGELEAAYPEHADELDKIAAGGGGIIATLRTFVSWLTGAWSGGEDVSGKYRLAVRYYWWRQPVRRARWTDAQTGEAPKYVETEAEYANAETATAQEPGRFTLGNWRVDKVLYSAVVCGDTLLEGPTKDPMKGVTRFPLVRVIPCKGTKAFNYVGQLIGPQQEENKRRSQELAHLNSTTHSGYMVPDGALTPAMQTRLDNYGATPGVSIVYNPLKGKPERIEPGQLSQGHAELAAQASQDIKEISGVSDATLGYGAPSGTPARLVALQQRAGMVVTEPIFDQYSYAMILFGQLLDEVITAAGVYSEAEILQIVDKEDLVDRTLIEEAAAKVGQPPQPPAPRDPQAMAILTPEDQARVQAKMMEEKQVFEQQAKQYQQAVEAEVRAEVMRQLRDVKVGRYGIKIDETANSPTVRYGHFLEAMELNKATGGAIPARSLVLLSDLPNKEQLANELMPAQAPPQQGGGMPSAESMGMQ